MSANCRDAGGDWRARSLDERDSDDKGCSLMRRFPYEPFPSILVQNPLPFPPRVSHSLLEVLKTFAPFRLGLCSIRLRYSAQRLSPRTV